MRDATPFVTSLQGSRAEEAAGGIVSDFMQLTKARLTMLVVITAIVGYCMASAGPFDWLRFAHTVVGTALVAGAAAVFNQLAEVNVDRLMERTRSRPLPSGRMSRHSAIAVGSLMGVLGLVEIFATTNLTATALAAITFLIYVLIYTPMKRRSSFCVTVGAVSGAIPPVIGWCAFDGSFGLGAWVLFGILFAWQMPHFLAIAWMYRDEYSQAGFVMLPRSDISGFWTSVQSLFFSVVLTAITLVPFFAGKTGWLYVAGAMLFNALMLVTSVKFMLNRSRSAARTLFFASIIYLPALLTLMVFTK